eukprot:COSAG01_NODE_19045_length_1034_cov_2.134759_2_plen_64_part_01
MHETFEVVRSRHAWAGGGRVGKPASSPPHGGGGGAWSGRRNGGGGGEGGAVRLQQRLSSTRDAL